jgi:uncharacterized protein (DUF2235 family)
MKHDNGEGSSTTTRVDKPIMGEKPIKRLILCFDGTAESFEGNSSDTNVVKLYGKFDRSRSDQLHFYQREVFQVP